MTRVLLATAGRAEELRAMASVAEWLQELGAQVSWTILSPPPAWWTPPPGVEVLEPEEGAHWPSPTTPSDQLADLARDPGAWWNHQKSVRIDSLPAALHGARAVLERWRPDAVGTSAANAPVVLAAHSTGVPWAGLSMTLAPVRPEHEDDDPDEDRGRAEYQRAWREVFARHGVEVSWSGGEPLSPHFNAVFATQQFTAWAGDAPPNVHLVGPALSRTPQPDPPGFPRDRLPSEGPLLLASFGSDLHHQPERFERLAQASQGLDLPLVLEAGDLAGASWAEALPSHVVACRTLPRLELLSRSRILITHGDAVAAMEGIAHAVPMVVVPTAPGEETVARFVERSSVGIVRDLDRLSAEALRRTLRELLDPAALEAQIVRQYCQSYGDANGGRTAARKLLELAGTGPLPDPRSRK